MVKFILQLSDPEATLENVGGKGMSLARLTRAGMPVPGGFHLTTEAYRQFVSANGLQQPIMDALAGVNPAQPSTLEEASRQIAGLFASAEMPAEIATAIVDAYAPLQDIAVAVRSSATAEDLPGASFAGQQETYLNIRGKEGVLSAVKRCWASLWTGRAIGYRIKNGIDQRSVALAVVVQELVQADAAGVLFTANPVNGRREEAMITAAWGLGEAVVSSLVSPDTFIVEKTTGRLVERRIADKQVMTVRTGSGTEEKGVPAGLRKKAALTNTQVIELARLGTKIEALYQMPMDIEWAITGEKFAILQARPITSLPESPLTWVSPDPKALLLRQSFAEFVPNPVSPLFASLGVPIVSRASQKLFKEFMPSYDVSTMTYYVVNQYVFLSFRLNPNSLWAMGLGIATGQIKKMLSTSQVRWQVVSQSYHETVDGWKQKDPALLTPAELLRAAEEIFSGMAEYYSVAQSGPIPSALSSELSFTRYYRSLVKRKGDPEAAAFLLGLDTLALRAEKSLFDLAQWIKGQPELADAVSRLPAAAICTALQTNVYIGTPAAWKEFKTRFDGYLAQFGHTVYDLDFAKPVPADDPAPLVEAIKGYLDGKGSDPYVRQRMVAEKREKAEVAISRRLDPLRRKGFLRLLHWAQDCGPKREDCIGDLGWGYPLLRSLLREIGRRLVNGEVIASPEDIYWLEAGEVEALVTALEDQQPLTSYTVLVEERKNHWQRVRSATVPLILPEKSFLGKLLPHENMKGNTLKGVGASGGKVTAPACVLLDPQDFSRMHPGDIIVAVTTTPAWTPLFAMAAGVVTEIGGPLSHSSIVAREFGIPAVLATGNATHRIRSGQMITVDGTAGKVIIPVQIAS